MGTKTSNGFQWLEDSETGDPTGVRRARDGKAFNLARLSADGTSLVSGDGKSLPLTLTQQHKRWMEFITVASTTPWNDQAGTGLTLAVDTAVLFNGQPTLRLDIPASSSGTYRVGTTLATLNMPYLWDGKQLAVAVKSSNMTACDGVTGVLLGDASFTNFYTFTGQRNAANVPQANWVAGDWIISRGTVATQTASGTFVGQKRLRINFTISSVGTATQIWIGFVGAAASKKPTVILSIDDGYASGYSFVAPLARYYKIPVSFGIDRAYVGSGNYFTAAQIQELHADPSNLFEFVTHGFNNTNLTAAGSATAYVQQQVDTRNYLRSLGIRGDGPNHHPWVQSLYSNAAQDAMKAAGFLSARMGASTPLSMHDSFMSTGDEKRVYQLVNCCTLTTGLSLGQAQTAVTTACTTEGYGVTHVNAHDFAVADAASPPTWSFDKMTEFMGWLDAQRTAGVCDIKSWGQWYADLAGVPYGK
jgi:hypothetical protein